MGELSCRFFIGKKKNCWIKNYSECKVERNYEEIHEKYCDMEGRMRNPIHIYLERDNIKNGEKAILEESMVGNFQN